MSHPNPAPIKIGMTGNLSGKQYRVTGRAVLGEAEAGAIYYWNEFNLEIATGEEETLVFEKTKRGGEWRLFRMFEPDYPMTAADAATKRIGDRINLDGTPVFVSFVSNSRVYETEGKPPEEVKVGDVAHYFNATAGDKMVVVSWTGQEVEFFKGFDLTRKEVAKAFNVRIVDFQISNLIAAVVGVFVVLTFVLVGFSFFASPRRAPALITTPAPSVPELAGKSGVLEGNRFQVQSHALVEMAMVGRKFDRHEYVLSDEKGSKALLVCGSKPGAADWWLFTPFQPQNPPSPAQAAALRCGQTGDLDGVPAKITEIFQSTIHRVESAEASEVNTGDVFFGFTGQTSSGQLLVRWNSSYINFFQGKAMPEKEVFAFGKTRGQ
jgi:hypothetical protein